MSRTCLTSDPMPSLGTGCGASTAGACCWALGCFLWASPPTPEREHSAQPPPTPPHPVLCYMVTPRARE